MPSTRVTLLKLSTCCSYHVENRDFKTKALADKVTIPSQGYLRSDVGVVRLDLNVQLAKKNAVIQAQSEGCLGNFRSFDSPFGNHLVPVIPTKADLLS
ncbi:uncharacterized protein LOC110025634 [Phalaenopsis equestris]|uniref:uncharacterized protein LOC110025634 n=1 Tax=Phalaenopsis equestris TaxID=78828 RepID=UPI0009E256A3|nr:uncharacterized protein LOC110025634 [Phalaenopsis equestris]